MGISEHISGKFSGRPTGCRGSEIAILDYPFEFQIGNLNFKFRNIILKNPNLCLYYGSCSDFQFQQSVPDLSPFDSDHHSDLLHTSLISDMEEEHYDSVILWIRFLLSPYIVCLFVYVYSFTISTSECIEHL